VGDAPRSAPAPASIKIYGPKALGQFVRELRGRAGCSQAALADRAGVSRNHIGLIERGVIASPRLSVLCQLAHALEVGAVALALAFLRPPGAPPLLEVLVARSAHPALRSARSSQAGTPAAARLGLMVRDLRGRARIGQEQLAAEAGLSRSTINKLERGMTSDPELVTLVRIACALTHDVGDPLAVATAVVQLISAFADEPTP